MILPKLVRDRVPELIEARGAIPQVRFLDRDGLHIWLIEKLREEILEFQEKPGIDELVDLYEVLRAIAMSLDVSFEEVELARERKYVERGGFQRGVLLEGIKEPPR